MNPVIINDTLTNTYHDVNHTLHNATNMSLTETITAATGASDVCDQNSSAQTYDSLLTIFLNNISVFFSVFLIIYSIIATVIIKLLYNTAKTYENILEKNAEQQLENIEQIYVAKTEADLWSNLSYLQLKKEELISEYAEVKDSQDKRKLAKFERSKDKYNSRYNEHMRKVSKFYQRNGFNPQNLVPMHKYEFKE